MCPGCIYTLAARQDLKDQQKERNTIIMVLKSSLLPFLFRFINKKGLSAVRRKFISFRLVCQLSFCLLFFVEVSI